MELTLSIVVGTKDRPAAYKRFKDSVERTVHVPYEIIVGDASKGFRYALDTATVRVLPEDPPQGTLKGYNRCFRECRGKWVAWFNDDCEMLDGWCEAALEYMENTDYVGLGAIYFKDRKEDGTFHEYNQCENCKYVVDRSHKWCVRCGKKCLPAGSFRVYDYPEPRYRRGQIPGTAKVVKFLHFPGIPHANFGILSRELGNQVGWFDESMGADAYGCDTSLCLLVVEAGKAVCRVPGCKIIHHRAFDESMTNRLNETRISDLMAYKAKWGPRIPELQTKHAQYHSVTGPEVIE